QLLSQYLRDKRPIIVAEAIDGLTKQNETTAISEVSALLNSQSPYIRNSVLRYLSKLYPEQAFPLLKEALQDPDYLVRENAVDELGELDKPEAIAYLVPLTKDPHPDVRQAVETAIDMLSCISVV
ncbi:MAG: HEAT repeat domain-containing protein, partial [Spirulinaceae cyanobacterium]